MTRLASYAFSAEIDTQCLLQIGENMTTATINKNSKTGEDIKRLEGLKVIVTDIDILEMDCLVLYGGVQYFCFLDDITVD